MLNYQSPRPFRNFLMIGNEIDDELSPDAYYLLVKLMKLAPNEANDNLYLRKKTGFSKRKFDRAKKELVVKKYIDTKQVYGNRYAIFIGKQSVKNYTSHKKKPNRHEKNEIRVWAVAK